MTLETKFAPFGRDLNVENGTRISGYASLFGHCDQGGDIVAPKAYATSLAQQGAPQGRVKMLWQHDPSQPIGVWDELREDARGLWVSGTILREVARGREAAALIAAKAIDGLSIGYRAVKAHRNQEGRRVLTEIDLWEVSLVTFPMLSDARVGAKAERASDASLAEIAEAMRAAGAALRNARPQIEPSPKE